MKKKKSKNNQLSGKMMSLFSALMLLFLWSCDSEIDSDKVEALKFIYLSREVTTPIAVMDSQDIFSIEISKDTIIRDRKIIEDYIDLVNALEKAHNDRIYNIRIVSFIKLKGREKGIELSFGWDDFIIYKGRLMENNQEMFNFLDQLLPEDVFYENSIRLLEKEINTHSQK